MNEILNEFVYNIYRIAALTKINDRLKQTKRVSVSLCLWFLVLFYGEKSFRHFIHS